jgi:hypothetical protein
MLIATLVQRDLLTQPAPHMFLRLKMKSKDHPVLLLKVYGPRPFCPEQSRRRLQVLRGLAVGENDPVAMGGRKGETVQ